MKKIAILAILLVASLNSWAQGTLAFANTGVGLNAPDFETDGTTKLAGAAYKAVLYFATTPDGATIQPEANLALLASSLSSYLSGGSAGLFFGGTKSFASPTFPAGTIITAQVRAWRLSDGADWNTASNTPGAHVGKSNLINVTLVTPPTTPPNLIGLQSFNLAVVVPEPSTIALGLLGGLLLLFRRRK